MQSETAEEWKALHTLSQRKTKPKEKRLNESKKNWSWGDIYSEEAEPEKFMFSEEKGVILNGETLV